MINKGLSSFLLSLTLLLCTCGTPKKSTGNFSETALHAVRFDPSYFYNIGQPVPRFVDSITAFWHDHGINTVFFKAYDPQYGAVYKTTYKHTAMTDYGSKDFMGQFLRAAHRNGLKFIVWLPVLEHRKAWENEKTWRLKDSAGSDLMPIGNEHHFLCPRNSEVEKWWAGFIADIVKRYPEIDGVDLAEPAIIWGNRVTCQCEVCANDLGRGAQAFSTESVQKRARDFTSVLLSCLAPLRAAGKITCMTVIPTAGHNGSLLSLKEQISLTGLDIEYMLNDTLRKPSWFCAELMWQQWADTYDDPALFTPSWTKKAVEEIQKQVNGRSHVVAHVELTPLGPVNVSAVEFAESIKAARMGGAQSIDFYDAHLADSLHAWPEIEQAWKERSQRKAWVLHQDEEPGAARQLAALLGHFDLMTTVVPVDSLAAITPGSNDLYMFFSPSDAVVPPENLLKLAANPDSKFFWVNASLPALSAYCKKNQGCRQLSFSVKGAVTGNRFNSVLYKGKNLYKTDSLTHLVDLHDTARLTIHSFTQDTQGQRTPYIVSQDNFWYVADCPVDYIVEGGRHIAFADLLHDFVGEDHVERHTGLVRIEDVCALSDPASIRQIADLLSGRHVPFAISLIPFYVDPDENLAISISDRPELVKAIRYAVSKGAAIVMHGSTHQFRGRTTHDYEFWDAINDKPLFHDSPDYVRARIERGFREFHRNQIFPVVWETPHYAASQLDYSIIDQYFSTEYTRRQVIDETGYDQLVPYYIPYHPSGTAIIPENLGYVPNDNQNAGPLIQFARNNLAVRDGFASFFFHPWIKLDVLSELVDSLKMAGYEFADIRTVSMKVSGPDFAQVTGKGDIALSLNQHYLNTFFIDDKGRKKQEWFSDSLLNRTYTASIKCPPRWTFVAQAVKEKPSIFSRFKKPELGIIGKVTSWLFTPPPLMLEKGQPAKAAIIWDSGSAMGIGSSIAWRKALKQSGIDPDTVPMSGFFGVSENVNLLVVPAGVARQLTSQQQLILSQYIADGGNAIIENDPAIAGLLGIHFTGETIRVDSVRDDYYATVSIAWKDTGALSIFTTDGNYDRQYSTFKDEPVVLSGQFGEGNYLIFAADFIPAENPETVRFPFLLDLIERTFDLHPPLRSPVLEVYYDPDLRENAGLEDLVRMWRTNGVKQVRVAAWHTFSDGYTFEYDYFVQLLHANGMLAYAWFDLPQVSEKFWTAHAQWREKTAAGNDAEIYGRKHCNFTNDTSRAAAFNAMKRILMAASWDGVCLNGTLYEGADPARPGEVTPMNASWRESYRQALGYDPVDIFDRRSPRFAGVNQQYWKEFLMLREKMELNILEQFVKFIRQQAFTDRWAGEIVISRRLDNLTENELQFYQDFGKKQPGSTFEALIAPGQGISQATIPAIIQRYAGIFGDKKPLIAIALDRTLSVHGTTTHLCGQELMAAMAQTVHGNARLAFLSEADIFDVDFRNISFAAASSAQVLVSPSSWEIVSKVPVFALLDERNTTSILLNNHEWAGFSKGKILLPGGKYTLHTPSRIRQWGKALLSSITVVAFNGTIVSLQPVASGLNLRYQSDHPAAIRLSKPAKKVIVDGLPYGGSTSGTGAIQKSFSSINAIVLPAGTHDVQFVTRGFFSLLFSQSSVALSVLLLIVSGLAIVAFTTIYLLRALLDLLGIRKNRPAAH